MYFYIYIYIYVYVYIYIYISLKKSGSRVCQETYFRQYAHHNTVLVRAVSGYPPEAANTKSHTLPTRLLVGTCNIPRVHTTSGSAD